MLVADPLGYATHQDVVVHAVKELFQIKIYDPAVALLDVFLRLRHCLMSRSPWPESVAVLAECGVPIAFAEPAAPPVAGIDPLSWVCRAFSCPLLIWVFLRSSLVVVDRSLTKAALSIATNSPAGNPAVLSPSSRPLLPPLRWLSRASALPSSSPSRTPPRSACPCSPDFPYRVSPP